MNVVCLKGRLSRDPEVRYTDGGGAVAKFSLAVDRAFKKDGDDKTTDFISCISFGKTAEFVEKYFTKGMEMALRGHIQTGSYTNRDGNKVYTTDVICDSIEFCGSKKDNQQNQQVQRQAPLQQPTYQQPQAQYQMPPQGQYQAPPQQPVYQGQYQQQYSQPQPQPQPQNQDWMNIPPGSAEELPFN